MEQNVSFGSEKQKEKMNLINFLHILVLSTGGCGSGGRAGHLFQYEC